MSEVRRKDYEMTDRAEMERLLGSVEYGFLGAVRPDGWPIVVPLNFVYLDGRLYFHGALEGEKMATLTRDGRVTFTAVEAFSLVPSYFRDPTLACPATQYYKSVVVRGRARAVHDVEEKARALQAIMEKLQPEGGHVPISASEPIYRKSLRTTAVVAVDVEEMTAKFKFGQNLPSSKRDAVAERLEARGCPVDHATVDAMRRYNR
jgi:nitroimidazol reductase NimA-like FMN-containing flavoprotein (pyridoxamine 5'-phosphate oxidase superfamily)